MGFSSPSSGQWFVTDSDQFRSEPLHRRILAAFSIHFSPVRRADYVQRSEPTGQHFLSDSTDGRSVPEWELCPYTLLRSRNYTIAYRSLPQLSSVACNVRHPSGDPWSFSVVRAGYEPVYLGVFSPSIFSWPPPGLDITGAVTEQRPHNALASSLLQAPRCGLSQLQPMTTGSAASIELPSFLLLESSCAAFGASVLLTSEEIAHCSRAQESGRLPLSAGCGAVPGEGASEPFELSHLKPSSSLVCTGGRCRGRWRRRPRGKEWLQF